MKRTFDMRCGGILRIATLACILALCGTTPCEAIVLDWSTLTWTPGSLTNSYNLDSSNPGNDVTITVSGNTSALGNDGLTAQPTPDISTFKSGGTSPADASLAFLVDYATASQGITVTISFNYANGVSVDSLSIFDIDNGNSVSGGLFTYQDQIRKIFGTTVSGAIVAADSFSTGAMVTVSNPLTTNMTFQGTATVADTSADGNATFGFASNNIKSISFIYGDGPLAQSNPAAQAVSLFDIQYTAKPVPEVGVGLGAAGVGLTALVALFLRRRR